MVFLGVISYGIYLWHKPYTELGERWAGEGAISDDFLTQLVLILALTIATATVSYYVLERPLINWSRRLGRRPRVGAASSGGPGRA
jgi:peptidoglycan/LPS O-acetylase OafA/YrhL